jgi:cytochrome c553
MMRSLLLTAALVLSVAALMMLLVVASGLPPMSAAEGHWAATEWLLKAAKRRTIEVQGTQVQPPPALDDPALVMRGAGHFETACRRCHGMPGSGTPALLREMLPPPPDLLRVRDRHSRGELFHIVKHGVKLSGMPGWPSQQRDDEVWAMVALLGALPTLGTSGYLGMAVTPPTSTPSVPDVVQTRCARCHGLDGLGRVAGAFPVLAGQHQRYLFESLRAFAYGTRHSGIMTAVASDLSEPQMLRAAAYYSGLPGLSATSAHRSGHDATLARAGDLSRKVPACASCHEQTTAINPAYPRLAGQRREYIAQQLRLFAERRRGGTAYAAIMHPTADRLTEPARVSAARYFGGR